MDSACAASRRYSSGSTIVAALALPLLAGCAGQLDHLGKAPSFSPVAETRDAIDPSLPSTPVAYPRGPDPFSAAGRNMATASIADTSGASLWSSGPRSLFGDRRAQTVGDILTVLIEIDDSASLKNNTTRDRSGSDSVAISAAYGVDTLVDRLIPGDTVGLAPGVDAAGEQASSGEGAISRTESISLRIAATVVDVLPNGHLVVTGSQEVRVNFELRDLQVAGVIRPEDITRRNTIDYDKMANARISYGGRGQIMDLQQPRIGQQLVDLVSPF